MTPDPHCRIGRVRLKGSRNITTRLPRKALGVFMELQAIAKARAVEAGKGER